MPAPNYVLQPCAHCGKPIRRTKAQIAKGVNRFCKRACYAAWRSRDRITRVCPICGKTFSRKSSRTYKRSYCSQACYDTARAQRMGHYVCQQCGKAFSRPLCLPYEGKFCSIHCRSLNRRLPESSRSIYSHEFTTALKRTIRKRDKGMCRLCHCKKNRNGRALHIHHIDYDKTNNHPSNLITLCASCHSRTHYHRASWGGYFREHPPQEMP